MPNVMRRDGPEYNKGLLAIIWLMTSAASIALCLRLYARYQRFKRLYWDDFFVILAWILLVPLAAQATVSYSNPATLDSGQGNLFLSRPVTQSLSYTALWCIKLSFLIFFRRIGACALPKLKRYFTAVLCITILAYCSIWTINPYGCWAKHGIARCERDHDVKVMRPVALGIATGLVVMTDCLIIAIPFVLLSNVRKIPMKKKLLLYSLFSVEVITVIVAIVRCVIATLGMQSDADLRVAMLLFLTHLEASIAIIVACVASLRSLFTQEDQSRSGTNATPKLQAIRVKGKRIGPPLSVRSIPLTAFSSNSHKENDEMTVPLSQFSAPPSRTPSPGLHRPREGGYAAKEYGHLQVPR
ncbi:hypothetical protein CC80DRAFT_590173 [Byssothecium circinans]|uniref:Rhodopsin domain-containing protein n=1 Tax=Byssothecium circinans TaxID=147558 RepID=A0A6A5UIF6_9PLEO|nr:hypothetical protein CC80DRAFT_590173 [Byssothecium circinans]